MLFSNPFLHYIMRESRHYSAKEEMRKGEIMLVRKLVPAHGGQGETE